MADSLQSIADELRAFSQALKDTQTLGIIAISEVEGKYKQRIFIDGKATNGSDIGQYSTKKIYVNPKTYQDNTKGLGGRLARKPKQLKNGKERRTLTFEKGYKQFRDEVGRQNKIVDTNLTSELQKSIQTGIKGGKAVLGFTNDKNIKKAEGLEDHFNKEIYTVSDQEIQCGIDVVNNYLFDKLGI